MKRKLFFAGTIVSIVTLAVCFSVNIMEIANIISAHAVNTDMAIFIIDIIEMAFMIVTVVFDCLILPLLDSSEKLMNKKVFSLIAVYGSLLIFVMRVFSLTFTKSFNLLNIVLICGILASTFLMAVDYDRVNKEINKTLIEDGENVEEIDNRQTEAIQKPLVKPEIKLNNQNFESKLLYIENLKDKRLITEEEYQIFRTKIIDKEMDK